MFTRQVDISTGRGVGARGLEPADVRGPAVAMGRYRTSWGMGFVAVSEGRLVGVELPNATKSVLLESAAGPAGGAPLLGAGPQAAPGVAPSPPEPAPADRAALDRWVGELEAYFRGERLAWKPEEIALDSLGLGPFELAVYATLLSIPPAVTVSYGTLAEMAGYPRAARAVGNAMAANPVPVVVPCHRVIRADGSLGRYGDDPAWKERLLIHERTHAPSGAESAADAERGRGR